MKQVLVQNSIERPLWGAFGLSLGLHALAATIALSMAWRGSTVVKVEEPLRVTLVSAQAPVSSQPHLHPHWLSAVLSRQSAPRPTLSAQRRLREVASSHRVNSEALAAPPSNNPSSPSAALPPESVATTTAAATIAATSAAPPTFMPASADAAYLHNPRPAFPPLARRRHQEGLVLVEVTVSPAGLATQVRLKQSSRVTELDEAALAAVRGYRFVPARLGERAVEGLVVVPVNFRLSD